MRTFINSIVFALLGAMLLVGCAAIGSPLVSNPAPQFSLSSIEGKSEALSNYRGKVVVLDFWATWCPSCPQRLAHLQALASDPTLDGKGAVFLTIDEQEDPSDIRSFMNRSGFTLPVLMDGDGAVARAYGVPSLPTTVVVNRDGTVAAFITSAGADPDQAIDDAIRRALAS